MRVDFVLSGLTTILFHANDVDASDELSEWRKDSANKNRSVAGDDRSPPWTWVSNLYSDGKHVAWPSYNLMVCLRQAGTQMVMKKQKTFKELSQSGIIMDSEYLTFLAGGKQIPFAPIQAMKGQELTFKQHAEAAKKMGFSTIHVKRARVGQSMHVRCRPAAADWAVRGSLTAYAPELTFEVLTRMFEIAGRGGLGDWRPACRTPGPYGMFSAQLKRVRETAAA